MILNFTVKALGKKRPEISNLELDIIVESDSSVHQFFEAVVAQQVQEFNLRKDNPNLLNYLSGKEIKANAQGGSVKFNESYNDQKADAEKATQNVLQSFEDGLIALFVNDQQYEALDEFLTLKPHDQIAIVRLTFLAGGLF
ncbi:MAG: hypothetical protein N4A46_10640 [Schleiferiaceae bacterium]|nr:hypothetical protein [Schleiferiaceae bacterium]